MRLLTLEQTPKQPLNGELCILACGPPDDSETCYHYRTYRDHGSYFSVNGLNLVFNDSQQPHDSPTGVTLEALLAICFDELSQQASRSYEMDLAAYHVLAARRALARD